MKNKFLINSLIRYKNQLRMNYTFVQKYNPISGAMQWEPQMSDYDYIQSIARSAYGDMVNDTHRNQLYHYAIKKAINKLTSNGISVNALDIGTGTGLLSMMCVKNGATTVNACECFKPMAKCATKIIEKNGFSDTITVIDKRSDELSIGPNGDITQKANLLVTEVFDTELIGEGAIHTFRHAIKNLLHNDALIVPSKARIYAQLVESKTIFQWNQFKTLSLNDKLTIVPPTNVLSCYGSNILHDIQINQLNTGKDFKIITEPKVIYEFDFTDHESLKLEDHKIVEFPLINDVNDAIVIFVWWELDMDFEAEFVLSCAPYWTYGNSETSHTLPWRDHWMQSIYYLPAYITKMSLSSGDELKIVAHRDDYSLWFTEVNENDSMFNSKPHICKCGIHSYVSRSRLGMINDLNRLNIYNDAIESIIKNHNKQLKGLFLGDLSLLPIVVASNKMIENVICLVKDRHTEHFIKEFSAANNCQKKIQMISNIEDINESIDIVFAEPYFSASDLPWHHLHYWYLLSQLRPNVLTKETIIMPYKAIIKALPVAFDHLWKIRSDVGTDIEGFDLSQYDQMIKSAVSLSDATIESQPLWEYSGTALTEKSIDLFEFDITKSIHEQREYRRDVSLNFSDSIDTNKLHHISIAFWIDFYLFNDIVLNSGPKSKIEIGKYIEWDRNCKYGVTFINNNLSLKQLNFIVEFDTQKGELKFTIN